MSVTVGAVCHVAHVVPVEFVFIQVVFISTIKSQASNSETSRHWQWMPVTCVFVALFKGYFWYSLVLSHILPVHFQRLHDLTGACSSLPRIQAEKLLSPLVSAVR